MTKRKEQIRYDYRGMIERGPRYRWKEGYSETTPEGHILYGWNTRAECRAEARTQGKVAVFYRDGTPEKDPQVGAGPVPQEGDVGWTRTQTEDSK